MRDFQKSKVYAWEDKFIPEGQHVPFEQIKLIVDYVWEKESLKYPPLIEKSNKNDKALGRGCRSKLFFPENGASTKTILHEIAHALTCDVNDRTNHHGADFVGIYIQLVDKHMNIKGGQMFLWHTANISNVQVNKFAKPWIERFIY